MLEQLLSSGEILESACIVQQPLCMVSSGGGRAVKMKGRGASLFIKQVVSAIVSLVKAKSMAVRKKTSSIKTRIMILRVLRNKKALLSSISQKIHALTPRHGKEDDVLPPPPNAPPPSAEYEAPIPPPVQVGSEDGHDGEGAGLDEKQEKELEEEEEDDDGYPDLRHCLFDEDDDGLGDCTGSVIDLVRNNRKEFKLEDEIDHVADVFIRRFHKQMRLQQQQSFKRYQEMLERSV